MYSSVGTAIIVVVLVTIVPWVLGFIVNGWKKRGFDDEIRWF